jgi:hypothetical protein
VAGEELMIKAKTFRETSQNIAPRSPSWLRGFFVTLGCFAVTRYIIGFAKTTKPHLSQKILK